jgi:hypothetical protein
VASPNGLSVDTSATTVNAQGLLPRVRARLGIQHEAGLAARELDEIAIQGISQGLRDLMEP